MRPIVNVLMLIVRLLSRLPFWILYLLSDFLFFISYRVVGYRRKLVWKNLQNAFPQKTDTELEQIEKHFYKNLCDYAMETLKLLTITKEELTKRMFYKDVEVLEKYKRKNQSVIFLASHNFNWEWLMTAGSISLPIPIDFVYQPLSNEFVNNFSLVCRTRFGAYPIKRDEVARETIRRKDLLRGIAIVADQYPGYKKDKKYHTTFLHQKTVFFYGANQLALLTQYPVVFAHLRKIRRGYYEVVLKEIATPPYGKENNEVLENYVNAVEHLISEDPSTWLWSHNRWKKRHLESEA